MWCPDRANISLDTYIAMMKNNIFLSSKNSNKMDVDKDENKILLESNSKEQAPEDIDLEKDENKILLKSKSKEQAPEDIDVEKDENKILLKSNSKEQAHEDIDMSLDDYIAKKGISFVDRKKGISSVNRKKDLRRKGSRRNGFRESLIQYRLMQPNISADRPRGMPTLLPINVRDMSIKRETRCAKIHNHERNQDLRKKLISNRRKVNDVNKATTKRSETQVFIKIPPKFTHSKPANNNTLLSEMIGVHNPVYDIKLQQEIHQIRNKQMFYDCGGTGRLISFPGTGVNCKVIPSTSGVLLNERFTQI